MSKMKVKSIASVSVNVRYKFCGEMSVQVISYSWSTTNLDAWQRSKIKGKKRRLALVLLLWEGDIAPLMKKSPWTPFIKNILSSWSCTISIVTTQTPESSCPRRIHQKDRRNKKSSHISTYFPRLESNNLASTTPAHLTSTTSYPRQSLDCNRSFSLLFPW